MKKLLLIPLMFFSTMVYASSLSIVCVNDINAIPDRNVAYLCKQPVEPSLEDITKDRAIEIAWQALSLNNQTPRWLPNSEIDVEVRESPAGYSYWNINFYNPDSSNVFIDRGVVVAISLKGEILFISGY